MSLYTAICNNDIATRITVNKPTKLAALARMRELVRVYCDKGTRVLGDTCRKVPVEEIDYNRGNI